ncbi:MAG: choice-of-anchor D domain-containing protein [Deltaproteobacteria bacterium]|nr:choice-of-anchor D domain-containing protein [Deltaproteobacteria bacterium]
MTTHERSTSIADAGRVPRRVVRGLGWAGAVLWLAGCLPLVGPGYPTAPPAPPPPPVESRPPPRPEGWLRATPSSLDFGGVDVGSAGTLEVRARNDGGDEVWVSGGGVEGEGFRIAGTSCERRAVRPGESCSVQVRFRPELRGRHAGALFLLLPDLGRRLTVPLSGEGLDRGGPMIAANVSRLDFDRSGTLEVEVRNEGRSELRIREVRAGGRGFDAASDECSGRVLAPGRSCAVAVRFRAEGPGDYSGTLTVSSDDPNRGRLTLPLTARGERRAAPEIQVEPATLDFGRVSEGSSRGLDVVVRNGGRADLRLRELRVEGRGFELAADGCSRSVLPPGRSCAATVRFTPQGPGGQTGTLTVGSDDPDQGRLAVPLRGEGESRGRPEARVTPSRLEFGRLEEGRARTLEVEIRNEGRSNLRVDDAQIRGSGFVLQRDGCSGVVVAPGRACVLSVRFSPEDPGARAGTLSLRTDDPARRRLDVALAGEGESRARPVLAVKPPRLDFGRVTAGEPKVLEAELRNDGRGELRIQGAVVRGPGFDEQADGCSRRSLAPGRSCRVAIRFTPEGQGERSGNLEVSSNDPEHPRLGLPLRAEGTARAAPELQLSSSRLDFGAVAVGQRRALELEVRNEGRAELRIPEATVEGRWFRVTRDECSRRVVAPGRSCSVSIEFAPDATGSMAGSLRLTSSDPVRPRVQIALEGTATGATGPKPCRTARLEPMKAQGGRSRAVVDLDLEPGECATYSISVEEGSLLVRAPEEVRFQGDGFRTVERGPGPPPRGGRLGRSTMQQLQVRKTSDVTFSLTRAEGGRGGKPSLVLEWVGKDQGGD